MQKGLLLILTILISNLTYSQNCNCSDNFTWLKETFEKNDAGFQYVIDQKGEADYKKFCETYIEKVKSITNKNACADTLLNWLRYFRRGHLWLEPIADKESPVKEKVDSDKIRKQYKDWETYKYDEKEFNAYVFKLKEPSLEGIWSSPPYKIGVIKVNNEYVGFIIEADGIYWSKSQVKFKIKNENGKFVATYYMQNHSPSEIKEVKLLGNNYLSMDFVLLKRIAPIFPSDKSLEMFFKFQSTNVPLFEKLSDKTVILRIPSFDGSMKKQIDSIIVTNMQTITKTENLIIDLQNNGGGSDESYEKLIPLIYTNPIRTVGLEYLSTPLNNKRMEEFANDPDASAEDKKWVKEAVEKLNKNLGKFVNLDSSIVSTETYDTIYVYPKNVGIIINGGCGSTTEQFLLAAKQSKKVKLFGTTTFGSLDISNMYSVKSPCNDLELGYCLSKSYRIPDFTIDGKGLQPDYYIDKTIPKYEWIDFVNKILSNK
jgi:hypothetical protein